MNLKEHAKCSLLAWLSTESCDKHLDTSQKSDDSSISCFRARHLLPHLLLPEESPDKPTKWPSRRKTAVTVAAMRMGNHKRFAVRFPDLGIHSCTSRVVAWGSGEWSPF